MNKVDLWGNIVIKEATYFVFHDESIPNKRWLLIGLLFVKDIHIDNVLETLHHYRQKENYFGEIHFLSYQKILMVNGAQKPEWLAHGLKLMKPVFVNKHFLLL